MENHYYFLFVRYTTIAALSLATIITWSVSVISISGYWIESFTISTNFRSSDVIWKAPDVTWNSNWPTWKFFYSFPGRLRENPAGLHGKPLLCCWNWMGMLKWKFSYKRYMFRNMWWWCRCSCQRRCCYSIQNILPYKYFKKKEY